jgi:hypothetical protein
MAPEYTELDRMGNSRSPRYGARIRNFLLHTQEGNGTAESLAAYLNNPANGVSYHYTIDNSVTVVDVVDTAWASWSVLDANPYTINLCFAGSKASWTRDQWLTNMGDAIDVAAYLAVLDCTQYGFATDVIRPPYYTGDGISDHQYVTDQLGYGTHTDVGPGFPWDVFEAAVIKYSNGEKDTMPSAEEIAAAVWTTKVAKPDGTTEQAGILLGWVDQHTGDTLDQLAGTDTAKQRTGKNGPLKPTGWAQLANPPQTVPAKPSLVDGVATRADIKALRDELIALIQGLRP